MKGIFTTLGVSTLVVACTTTNTMGIDGGDDGGVVFDTGAKDSSKMDASNDSDSGGNGMCPTPADVSSYMPPPFVPPIPFQNVCSQTDIQGFYDNCLSMMADTTKCNTWVQANMKCANCIDTADTDPAWGALIEKTGIVQLDVAGCVEGKGDHPCAAAIEALDACDDAACAMQCPVTDDPMTFTLYQSCVKAADIGGCKTYASSVASQCQNDASAAYAACSAWSTFDDGYFLLAPIFCSGGGG